MSITKKILVVDDDPDIIEFCTTVLETSGYKVISATSGQEGLETAEREKPDLVVLDIMMEEVDSGFQVARTMGRLHGNTPILMLSSIADASARSVDTSQLPVAMLVEKPIKPEDLVQKVQMLLKIHAG